MAQAQAQAQEIVALKNSIRAHKGHFTRLVDAANRATRFMQGNISQLARQEAEKCFQDLKNKFETVQQLYKDLGAIDVAQAAQYITAAEVNDDEFQATREDLLTALRLAAPAPQVNAPGAQPNAARIPNFKAQSGVKPDKLQADADPLTYRAFVRAFDAFYRMSRMDTLAVVDQQAVLFQMFDRELEASVRQAVDENTPIFGPVDQISCMSALADRFDEIYPLFSRRLDFWMSSQPKGGRFTDWAAKLQQQGEEADLAQLDLDGIHAFRLICGCTDAKLRDKFLKLRNPTRRDVMAEARTYEASLRAVKDLTLTNAAHGSTIATGAVANVVTQDSMKGSCYGCGGPMHKGPDRAKCPAAGTTCGGCGRKNHFQKFCFGANPPKRKVPAKVKAVDADSATPTTTDNEDSKAVEAKSTAKCSTVRCAAVEDDNKAVNRPTPRMNLTFHSEDLKQKFQFDATPDTGATRTIVAENVVKEKGFYSRIWRSSGVRLATANGSRMKCVGSILLAVRNEVTGANVFIDALVVRDMRNEILLSWHDLVNLCVIPCNFPSVMEKESEVQVQKVELVDEEFVHKVDGLKVKYSDVLGSTLEDACGQIKGPPMKIYLVNEAGLRPRRVYTARPVPIHFKKAADDLIEELLRAGVIVPVTEPTEWVSPGHFVAKPDGRVRLVTDYTALNNHVKRPIHPFPSAKDLMQRIDASSRFFAKIDAIHGYFQIPLDEDSSKLTTFLLPSGRYRYKAAPMGLCASSDEFCRRTDEAFQGLDWFLKIVDDGLIQGKDLDQLFDRIDIVLGRCRKAGIKVSLKKFQFGTEVKFAGHIVSADGVKPDPEKIAGLREFPVPENLSQLRSFLGLANQLGMFVPDITHMSTKMRTLLKKGVAYVWTPDHQAEFVAMKELLCSDMIVHAFDPSLPTTLLTDASRLKGIGYALIQVAENGTIRLINCNSASLAPAERNYAMIELEALAIKWAILKCDYYLRGMSGFTVVTDHKPLTSVFSQSLQELKNQRLSRFREKLVDYNFKVIWSAGKDHLIADALSRAPVFEPMEGVDFDEDDVPAFVARVSSDPLFNSLFEEAKRDKVYTQLLWALQNDKDFAAFPVLSPFASVAHRLSIFDDGLVILDGDRIVVPGACRDEIVKLLHVAHTGVSKTIENAKQLYFWPGMANDIKQKVASCSACVSLLPSQKKETFQSTMVTEPMDHVDIDLFDYGGKDWLVMADRFSGYPFVHLLKQGKSTEKVVGVMLQWFLAYGFPKRARSDNGPQFRDKFKEFCMAHNIELDNSSPYNPQSNGLAEAAVKSVKYLVQKCHDTNEDLGMALLEWRNCPRTDGVSPSQAFFGRRLRGILPAMRLSVVNFPAHAADVPVSSPNFSLSVLEKGDVVWIQDPLSNRWNSKGQIISIHDAGRSYIVETDGRLYRRNRTRLRPFKVPENEVRPEVLESADSGSLPKLRRSPRLNA